MERKQFEAVIARAIAELPQQFQDGLKNIAVLVADRPSRQRRGAKTLLLGLYEGVPLPERTHDDAGRMPDTITLFQENLEAICHSEDELVAEIQKTLLHEIGHFFGLTERQLHALGY